MAGELILVKEPVNILCPERGSQDRSSLAIDNLGARDNIRLKFARRRCAPTPLLPIGIS